MFADDVKLYVKIVNESTHACYSLRQWAELWQLTVSVDKYCVPVLAQLFTALKSCWIVLHCLTPVHVGIWVSLSHLTYQHLLMLITLWPKPTNVLMPFTDVIHRKILTSWYGPS